MLKASSHTSMSRWTRKLTNTNGMNKEDFVKGLIAALTDKQFIEAIPTAVFGKLQDEKAGLKETLLKKDEKNYFSDGSGSVFGK